MFHLFFSIFLLMNPLLWAQNDIKLGVKTIEYQDEARNRPVIVELWYPTKQTEPFDTPSDQGWIHPKEIRNAEMSHESSPYPLLLMSHGHRGDRRERSWLADLLVKEGYIVASIDHHGDTRSTFNPLLSLCFWDRALDISFALTQLSKENSANRWFDPKKIGFIGYSLGGMTGLALAGAKAQNVQKIAEKIVKNYREISPKILDGVDFSIAETSYLEPRIQAILLICPAAFVYPEASLKQIKTPIGLIAAIGDEVLPHKHHSYQIIKYAIPKKLKVMRKEISHYSFLNRVSEFGHKVFHPNVRSDPPCCDRAQIHREAGRFVIDFFNDLLYPK